MALLYASDIYKLDLQKHEQDYIMTRLESIISDV